MAGSPPFPTPLRTVDLVVLCFGAGLTSEARMLRQTVLPAVTGWCTERSLQLRVHPRWPEDTAQRDDERPRDLAETPVDRLRELVRDDHVFVVAVIGSDMTDADVELITSIRNARPGRDERVLYVFLPRPGGDPDAVRPLFAELWRGAHVLGYEHATPDWYWSRAMIDLLRKGLGLSPDPHPWSRRPIDEDDVARVPAASLHRPAPPSEYEEPPPEPAYSLPHPMSPPPQEPAGRPRAAVVDENVQFTVYRPNAVQPEVWYPLLAFAHLAERRPEAPPGQPDPLEQVRALAAQAGVEAFGAPRVDARGGVPREGQLTFVPFVEGVAFNPRSQTFEWQEDVHQQIFRLKARSDTTGNVLRGQLTVYLGAFILADIDLTFRVDLAAQPPPTPAVRPLALLDTSSAPGEPGLTPVTAVPYQKVFPSYSHKDLAIVAQAEAYGKALGHVYLRDRMALRSGEQWEVRLLQLIDESDIFQLFWSSNSMRSEYVRREWEHAITLGRPGFIRPTYWEVPMPQSANPPLPPDTLAGLHFHGFFEESDGSLDRAWPSPRAQLDAVDELRKAYREATDPSVQDDILAILRGLKAKPWATSQTASEVEAVLAWAEGRRQTPPRGPVPPPPSAYGGIPPFQSGYGGTPPAQSAYGAAPPAQPAYGARPAQPAYGAAPPAPARRMRYRLIGGAVVVLVVLVALLVVSILRG